MAQTPSEGLAALAGLAASIEAAGNEIEDLDVTFENEATSGSARVTVPLVRGDTPSGVRIDAERVAIADGSLRIDVDLRTEPPDAAASATGDASATGPSATDPSATGSSTADTAEPPVTDGPEETTERPEDTGDESSDATRDSPPPTTRSDDGAEADAGVDDDPTAARSDGAGVMAVQSGSADGPGSADAPSADVDSRPAYRDPDRLEAVYDPDATFAEMTEELGVDVTPQTVRKYMVEHGVHEPKPRTDRLLEDAAVDSLDSPDRSPEAGGYPNEEVDNGASDDDSDIGGDATASDASDAENGDVDNGDAENGDGDGGDVDGGSAAGDEAGGGADSGNGKLADGASAETAAAREAHDSEPSVDAIPHTALPQGVTPAELVDAVTDSRTVYEVRRELGLEDERARALLKRCDLIDLVTGRIDRGEISPTEREVVARLVDTAENADSLEA
ncbi:hypothetical protein [Halorubrum lipolyticum]|uniref:Uncharacterized protein n=1 Tax=Halorubrum lipolyticum DSM 21995 TaxID=1227482 RepID=M0NMK1_9EURY|nr:hypothetical protein [Halorubrum lipolyticum]EMA58394.1 hypothetical protein C469_13165 [Halorubrum lipolyticum DSM 21995]